MLVICHNFIRKYNEISSVSLREIRRFNIFYEFFYDYIKLKKKNEQKNTERSSNNNNFTISNIFSFLGMKELDIHISAINLSIFICYYMRITNKQLREMLYNQLNQKICMLNNWFNGKDFLEIPLNEEKFIADNIQIDIQVEKYSDEDASKKDLIKIVTITVQYEYMNSNQSYELKKLKIKEI